jgi:hypothetical protein
VNIAVAGIIFSRIGDAVLFLGDYIHIDESLLEAGAEEDENRRKVRTDVF